MKRDTENQLPRVRTTCEHGLPKFISAERWLRLGEAETVEGKRVVFGGLAFVRGQLCGIFFANQVYRALPLVTFKNANARKQVFGLVADDDRKALEDLLQRHEAGEWREQEETVWAEYQREQYLYIGF